MSWFSIAKTALSQAQKSIDKVLDIDQENDAENRAGGGHIPTTSKRTQVHNLIIE